MTTEQQRDLQAIISKYHFGLAEIPPLLALAKDIHNEAVKKCAMTAEADLIDETAWHEAFAEVNDKSILKNLIS